MGWFGETLDWTPSSPFRSDKLSPKPSLSVRLIVTSALIIWKGLICMTGSESPVVVGDILFLHMSEDPIHAGEIVVFNVDGRDIPIVHEQKDTGEVYVLTKGDNNDDDDRSLYARGQRWLHRRHIMGRAVGMWSFSAMYTYKKYILVNIHVLCIYIHFCFPAGFCLMLAGSWVTIIMTEKPIIKYILIGALGLLVITSKD
ncbi:unnamed protein product [Malus baccata var. baccata]